MSLFLLNKESRDFTEEYISIGFWWDEEPVHKLVSFIQDETKRTYYLFNFIKIFVVKG
ncbi:MAG: hypothetical protein IKU37_09655 [Candidatus Gastranaerophilales bacterium]|nr:hypothetical protein [Candidatus Gastranaerophilales bacterium]